VRGQGDRLGCRRGSLLDRQLCQLDKQFREEGRIAEGLSAIGGQQLAGNGSEFRRETPEF
jgi:hypothetical protein